MNDDIKAIRGALAAGPTPGPWHAYIHPLQPHELDGRADIVGANRDDDVAENSPHKNAAYIAACSPDRIARLLDALEQAQKWRGLYRRAVNEANGLTNYVEDRPELTRAERKLTAIEAEARAIDAAMAGGQ